MCIERDMGKRLDCQHASLQPQITPSEVHVMTGDKSSSAHADLMSTNLVVVGKKLILLGACHAKQR